jgi:hypothetical protein
MGQFSNQRRINIKNIVNTMRDIPRHRQPAVPVAVEPCWKGVRGFGATFRKLNAFEFLAPFV